MSQLSAILKHATSCSRFYRDLGIRDKGLEHFPVINRSILSSNLSKLITIQGPDADDIVKALQGSGIANHSKAKSEFLLPNRIFIEQTSGTSGIPLRLAKTAAERSQLALAAWKCRKMFDPSIQFEGFLPLFHRSLDSSLPEDPFASSAEGIKRFYEWVARMNIRWIHAPPGLVAYHARMLLTQNMRGPSSLKYVETSGSQLEDCDRIVITKALGAKVINQYGTRESWAIGYADGLAPFQINRDAVHVELLDQKNNPILEFGREGSVTVTSTILRLIPIIRYKTGDRGSWTIGDGSSQALDTPRLVLANEREINMIRFRGKLVSGNMLFKEILHKIDHRIGYGYTEFIQIRKVNSTEWKLVLYNCEQSSQIYNELSDFLTKYNPAIILNMQVIDQLESKYLAERKPYLFVNESDDPATT